MARVKIKVNDIESFEEIVQTIYDETQSIINQAQNEINVLASSSSLKEEMMDGKGKYSKAIHDFIGDKDKAVGRRIEIAKLLEDMIKNQGNVQKTLSEPENAKEVVNLSLESLREKLNAQMSEAAKTQLY